MAVHLAGAAVLVTGGANGFAAAAARRLAGQGASVVVADIDERAAEVAAEMGGRFARCDVREAWYVQPGRPAEPFAFRHVPGPRAADGSRMGGIPGLA